MERDHSRSVSGIDDGPILKEGWLTKQGGRYKSWKRRYFVLKPTQILYYKTNQKRKEAGNIPVGSVTTVGAVSTESIGKGRREKKGNFFKVNVSGPRSFYLIEAENQVAMNEWITCIRKAVAHLDRPGKLSLPPVTEGYSTEEEEAKPSPSLSGGRAMMSGKVDLLVDVMEMEERFQDDEVVDEETRRMRSMELYQATLKGNISAAKALLGLRADPCWCNDEEGNRTALHTTASCGNRALCEILIRSTKGHYSKDSMDWTPVHMACYYGNVDFVSVWLELPECDISAKDKEGRTALYVATVCGQRQCAALLLEEEINRDAPFWRELHLAALKGDTDKVVKQIENGCTPNVLGDYGITPIHLAACSGSAVCLNKLISLGADVNALDAASKTPLHNAASSGSYECIGTLIQHGAAIDALDNRLKAPLHMVAGLGYSKCVHLLLEKSASINVRDEANFTPLHTAAIHGWKDCIEVLLDKGFDVNVSGAEGITPLYLAANGGYLECIKVLIAKGAELNATTDSGRTALHETVAQGHAIVSDQLIKLGSNVDCVDNEGNTPLHIAVAHQRIDCCYILIQNGANVNMTSIEGTTPLRLAVLLDKSDFASILLDSGATASITVNSNTPLHEVAENGFLDCARVLLDNNIEIDSVDSCGWTPLLKAVSNGHLEVVEFLITRGANIHHKAEGGWTSIHEAAFMNRAGCLDFLHDRGASFDSRDNDGLTPLHQAALNGSKECLQHLIERGVNINAKDNKGHTALTKAALQNRKDCAMLLLANSAELDERSEMALKNLMQALASVANEDKSSKPDDNPQVKLRQLQSDLEKEREARLDLQNKIKLLAGSTDQSAEALQKKLEELIEEFQIMENHANQTQKAPVNETSFNRDSLGVDAKENSTVMAKNFLQQAQALLTKEEYRAFQVLLKDYKSKKLHIDSLIAQIKKLFATPEKQVLLQGFVTFIPPKFKKKYEEELQNSRLLTDSET